MPQRTNISEEVGFWFRENDAVHPSLVVILPDLDRREQASLAGSRPPSRYQSACDKGRSLFVWGDTLQDLVQDLWRENHGCVRICGLDPWSDHSSDLQRNRWQLTHHGCCGQTIGCERLTQSPPSGPLPTQPATIARTDFWILRPPIDTTSRLPTRRGRRLHKCADVVKLARPF